MSSPFDSAWQNLSRPYACTRIFGSSMLHRRFKEVGMNVPTTVMSSILGSSSILAQSCALLPNQASPMTDESKLESISQSQHSQSADRRKLHVNNPELWSKLIPPLET